MPKLEQTSKSSVIEIEHRDGRKLTMQRATQDDLPAIVDIYNENVTSKQVTADLKPVSVNDRQKWFESHVTRYNRPIYVLKNSANDVMGWGSFNDVTGRPAYHISSEISLYVSRHFHRQGLATLLLSTMLEQAPSLNIHNVVALIIANNQPSIAFFTEAGFEQWGKLPNICDMDGFHADVVIYGRAITL